ncbi:MAG: hypothetical protein HY929_00755 [Euryarchaeota archaeon]|nr:hypothetical protein [Euryarchaeota archaeon]
MPSSSAAEELLRQGLDLNDIKEILERGFDCARSKRKAGTLEKCIIVGDWLRKAVVIEKALSVTSLHLFFVRKLLNKIYVSV